MGELQFILEKSADVHETHPVVLSTQYIVAYTATTGRVNKINFVGRNLGDDAYMSHDSSACRMAFKTNHIAGSGVRDGDVDSRVVKQR